MVAHTSAKQTSGSDKTATNVLFKEQQVNNPGLDVVARPQSLNHHLSHRILQQQQQQQLQLQLQQALLITNTNTNNKSRIWNWWNKFAIERVQKLDRVIIMSNFIQTKQPHLTRSIIRWCNKLNVTQRTARTNQITLNLVNIYVGCSCWLSFNLVGELFSSFAILILFYYWKTRWDGFGFKQQMICIWKTTLFALNINIDSFCERESQSRRRIDDSDLFKIPYSWQQQACKQDAKQESSISTLRNLCTISLNT